MTTRREVQDDPEFENLKRGDTAAAYRARKVKTDEDKAVASFFTNHPEVANVDANRHILLMEARQYGAVITEAILDLIYRKVASSLIATPPPKHEPSAAELAAEERKRLASLSTADLHAELQQKNYRRREPADQLSADCASLKTAADVRALSATAMKRLMYRPSDGSARVLNQKHINRILAGNQN